MHAHFRRLAIGSAVPAIMMASPVLAQAITFHVPAQDVASAVRLFARQAKVQIMVSGHVAEGRRTQAVTGAMTVDQALERMLANTGLAARTTGAGTYVIVVDQGAALQDAPVTNAKAEPEVEAAEIVVLGGGATRSVSTLLPPTSMCCRPAPACRSR